LVSEEIAGKEVLGGKGEGKRGPCKQIEAFGRKHEPKLVRRDNFLFWDGQKLMRTRTRWGGTFKGRRGNKSSWVRGKVLAVGTRVPNIAH